MTVDTLFLTNRNDVSIEYLIGKYKTSSENYLRINSEDINFIEFEIVPGISSRCTVGDKEYDLNNVKSVVFRRVPSRFEIESDGENRPYLNGERKHFLEGLFLNFEHAKWINPMFATQIAERKVHQLHVASRLGLKIPKSFIGNNRKDALAFLEKQKACIIKPVSNGLQVLPDRSFSIYTTEITRKQFAEMDLAETFDTPVFLQERIDNNADLRITIVGNHVFPVEISKVSDEVDWRKPDIVKAYNLASIPDELKTKLLELNRHWGLTYSAIDLIRTPLNEYVFLEVNPVGEWVWLEMELGLKISEKLINELLCRN